MSIKDTYRIYGYTYHLYASEFIGTNDKGLKRFRAIYCHSGDPDIYEVMILREMPPDEFIKQYTNYIKYPGTSQWGKLAWTHFTLENAFKKYNEIPSILVTSARETFISALEG